MSRILATLIALVTTLTLLVAAPASPTGEWRSADGAWCAFDGDFYSYVNATGQGIKLWVPPGGRPVRGIILFGNPGGTYGGDTRDKTRQRDLLEFAAWHDFAVGGVNGFPGLQIKEIGRHVIAAADAWAARGAHPELARAPFIFSGSSNAGMFSVGMLSLFPERTLAITPNVGPYYQGLTFGPAQREVPAWIHVGLTDPFFPVGVERTESLFHEQTPQGARWAWDAEIKGHQTVSSDHVDVAFWNAVIPLRLPAKPGEALRGIPVESGWWADYRTWDHEITQVAPANTPKPFAGEPSRYLWLPTEGMARLYQATATRARNLILSVADAEQVAGGETTGVYLSAGGGYVASPGDRVKLRVSYAPLQPKPSRIEVYDQEKLLGTFDPNQTNEFTFGVPSDRAVLALHLRGHQKRWDNNEYVRVSNPVQIVVRHPERSRLIDAQFNAHAFARQLLATDPAPVAPPAPAAPGETLSARRLSAAQADTLRADGKLSAFWTGPDAPAPLAPNDNASIQVAWSDSGLFLRFRIKDATTGKPEGGNAGRFDIHLARVSLETVKSAALDPEIYAAPKRFGILRSTMQFAFPLQGDLAISPTISVNRWDPWDYIATDLTATDRYADTGIWIDRLEEAPGLRSAEVFIPWKLVGNPGFTRAPSAGTSLATVFSYSPLGAPSQRFFWPYEKNPWLAMPEPQLYGQILLQP